ncbi:MAG: M20/M25/M40 family metallo-hydrolase [Opitutaceae bacterium]|nr:M20/M25/M40 family metallo-hydrolase [Cytophagales bacterium]
MNDTSFKFLESYINNASPTGFETSGQHLWLEYLKPYIDEKITDNYGSAVGVINPGQPYKVVIEAHADEISWFVNHITDDGYIYVKKNGGSDQQIAPSMRVNLHTKNGIVKGVFGWPAIHVRENDKEPIPTLKNLTIDCGCAKKDEILAKGIHVGTVVTFDADFFVMNEKFYVGRALDNRIGGFMIAEVARQLKENNIKLPYTLYVVNAVQEEIGLRGAEMIANRLKPDVAVITDVFHDTQSPLYDKKTSGDIACGRGPVVTYGPAVQNNLLNMIIDVADKKGITIQRAAASRSTGTDTDSFAYANGGTPSALISLPLKYMHTTVETVNSEDVEKVIQLMYEFLLELQPGHDFRYIK